MCTRVFVFLCCFFFRIDILQKAKGATAEETLKRGRLYLTECGLKPLTLAAKMKSSSRASVSRGRDVATELDRDDLTTVRQFMPQVRGSTIQIIRSNNQFTSYYPDAIPGSITCTWGLCSPRLRYAGLLWSGVGHSIQNPQDRHIHTIWASSL